MILGRIRNKLSTVNFEFLADYSAKKFEYVKVAHQLYGFVLCQIIELERDAEKIIAKCNVIGYKDKEGRIRQIRTPFEPGTEVLKADKTFIKDIIQINTATGAYIGKLDGLDIDIYLDLNKLLTKHLAVLAKSGSGKSYTTGVLAEEIIEKGVPLLIIDPHGEYSSLKYPNDKKEDTQKIALYNIIPKSYVKNINEFGDISLNPGIKPLKLESNLSADEIMHILPVKLSNAQANLLYSVLQGLEKPLFDDIILELQQTDAPIKWSLISSINYLKNLNLFSNRFTHYNELIQPKSCSILNLKGIAPEVQEIIVYKLMKDLFEERKKEKIPPFFVIIEEAHNFLPERGFGEAKSSKIMRLIASEGRKFGLGLCIVSQRPARCDKSVLSQCSTQIILKVTNPNDLRAIAGSVEGISYETETEIKNLAIGTAMITGIVDLPLFVNIRPRKTKHGGEAVDILSDTNTSHVASQNILGKIELHAEILPLIKPKTSLKDIKLMSDKQVKIKSYLIPAALFHCQKDNEDFNLLVELFKGSLVPDTEKDTTVEIPDLQNFSIAETSALQLCSNRPIKASDLVTRLGLGLFRAQSILDALTKKGALIKKNKLYSLSSRFQSIANIKEHCFLGRMEFAKAVYDKMLDKKFEVNDIKEKLDKLVEVKDFKECYILHHMIE